MSVGADNAGERTRVKLSELIASMRANAGTVAASVGDDWLQGRSVFGGLQAAIALAAMRTLIPVQTPLRTLQMTFIAPIESGLVTANARVLRAGKSATHAEARLEGPDGLQAQAIGVFGVGRDSIVRQPLPAPAPFTGARRRLGYAPGMPSFLQHFDADLLTGAAPFANANVVRNVYEIGLRDSGPMTEAHLLAIADFVPPVALSWMPKLVPGSSLTWMLELLDHGFAAQPLSGWRVASDLVAARDGYTSQSTTLWAPDATPVALSRQSMVVFG